MLKSILYSEFSRSWQIDAASRFYIFELDFTRAKRRKLQIEELNAQNAISDEDDSNWDEDDTQSLNLATIKARVSTLFASSLSCSWTTYLKRFANCRIQRSNKSMRFARAFRLLQIVAAFGCSEHFMTLKNVVAHYRVLASEELIKASLDLSSHLYTVELWTERLELINMILQRFVRAHFTSLIDEETNLFQDRSEQMILHSQCAIIRFIKTTMIKIYSRMKEWNSFSNHVERFAFLNVQRNLRRWRREDAIWFIIQNRFSSLALLALVFYHVRMLFNSQSISESS